MALFVNQENTRTKLQQKIAAELAEKSKKKAVHDGELPDGVEDSAYLKDTKKTTSLAWAWVLIIFAAVAIIIWLAVESI
jgi:hypothetical protein